MLLNLVKNVRKLEKSDYKYCELQLDLDFLQTSQHSNVNTPVKAPCQQTCQKRLLKEEININKNKIKQYLLEFNSVKKHLQSKIGFFNFG